MMLADYWAISVLLGYVVRITCNIDSGFMYRIEAMAYHNEILS